MRRFSYITFLLIQLSLTFTSAQAKVWSLQECIDSTLSNRNHRLAAAREQRKAALAAVKEERANLYGSFDLGGNYIYNTEVQKVDLPITIPGRPSPTLTFGDHNTYDLFLSAKYPLYTGRAQVNRYRAVVEAGKAAEFDEQSERVSLVADVRRAYYTALGTQEAMGIAHQNHVRAIRHEQEVRDAVTVGTMSKESYVLAKANRIQAEMTASQAGFDWETAKTNLRTVTGLLTLISPDFLDVQELWKGTKIKYKPSYNSLTYDSLSGLMDSSSSNTERLSLDSLDSANHTNSPLFKAMNQRAEQMKYLTSATKGSWYPALGVQGTYHYAKPGVNMVKNEWMNYSTIGLQASWSLFDWGARNSRIEKAKANQIALQQRKDDLGRNIDAMVTNANIRVKSAYESYTLLTVHAVLLRKRQEMVESRWKQGQATESEWKDAFDDMVNVDLNLNNALVRYWLARTEAMYASGIAEK